MPNSNFCLLLTLEKVTFSHCVQIHDWLKTKPSTVKAPNQRMPIQTENCPQCQEWIPYKVGGAWKPLWAKGRGCGLPYPVPTKAFLQPRTTATMYCTWRVTLTHLPLSHHFCLLHEQSPSPQHIAKCWCKQKRVKQTPCRSYFSLQYLCAQIKLTLNMSVMKSKPNKSLNEAKVIAVKVCSNT